MRRLLLLTILVLSSWLGLVAPTTAAGRPADQVVDLPDVTTHYSLDVAPFDLASGPIEVSEHLDVQRNSGAVSQLLFTVAPNHFGYFMLESASVNGAAVATSWPNDDTLALPVSAGDSWGIDLHFRLDLGQVPWDDWRAMGRDGSTVRLGNWFPIISNDHAYPATADSGSSRSASFDVWLPLPAGVPFASTGSEVDSQALDGGLIRHHLHADNVRDFAALISPDYAVTTGTSAGGVKVEVYGRTDSGSGVRATALAAAVDALDALGNLIGPYSYPVFRVADPGANFPHGLEFPNLVFINLEISDLRDTVLHETAHQWMYGVIGNRTQRDLWIDEGGAQFLELGLSDGFGAPIQAAPSGGYGYALDSADWELPQDGNLPGFDAIYLQGRAFYQTVLAEMGSNAFWGSMHELYANFQFGIVTPLDMLLNWQTHSPVDLRPLFSQTFRYSWIDQLPGPAGDTQYFQATGQWLSGQFLHFWQQSGGLPVFGYPLTPVLSEGGYSVQYLERQRFEAHPEFAGTPYAVELGLLGVEDAQRRGLTGPAAFQPLPATTGSDANCTFYPQTGHRLCFGFRSYWQGHGLEFGDPGITYRESLALFGYPISEEFVDPQTGFVTQYFERARLEYHPENPDPYKVEGGLLGRAALGS